MTDELVKAPPVPTASDVATRVEAITQDADLSWVVNLLGERRDEILDRWLEAAGDHPLPPPGERNFPRTPAAHGR